MRLRSNIKLGEGKRGKFYLVHPGVSGPGNKIITCKPLLLYNHLHKFHNRRFCYRLSQRVTPFKGFGEPDELIGTVLGLASDSYKPVSGIGVPVDGSLAPLEGYNLLHRFDILECKIG